MEQDLADLLIAVSRSLPLGIHTREQALDLDVDKYYRTLHFIDSQVQQGKVREAPTLDTIFELNLESINTFSPHSVLTPAREIRLYENAANARRKKLEFLGRSLSFEEQIGILTEVHGIYSTALQVAESNGCPIPIPFLQTKIAVAAHELSKAYSCYWTEQAYTTYLAAAETSKESNAKHSARQYGFAAEEAEKLYGLTMRPAWGRKALNSRREAAELTRGSDPKYSADQFGYAGDMAFRLAGRVQTEKEHRIAKIALSCFNHYVVYYANTTDPLKVKIVHEIQGKMEGLRALLNKV